MVFHPRNYVAVLNKEGDSYHSRLAKINSIGPNFENLIFSDGHRIKLKEGSEGEAELFYRHNDMMGHFFDRLGIDVEHIPLTGGPVKLLEYCVYLGRTEEDVKREYSELFHGEELTWH